VKFAEIRDVMSL